MEPEATGRLMISQMYRESGTNRYRRKNNILLRRVTKCQSPLLHMRKGDNNI